jgi:hypothetical protein
VTHTKDFCETKLPKMLNFEKQRKRKKRLEIAILKQ